MHLHPLGFFLGPSPLVVEPPMVGGGRKPARVLGKIDLDIPERQGTLLNQPPQHRRHLRPLEVPDGRGIGRLPSHPTGRNCISNFRHSPAGREGGIDLQPHAVEHIAQRQAGPTHRLRRLRNGVTQLPQLLRTGGTASTLGGTVKAPSTLGTFLRSFRWGHVRQLDRVSRELLARAWQAGAGPGDSPLTIDLDSTICETYGLAKEGARHHGYTGKRGYHPLLAVAAGTGDVLMARLREGRANTARGAAHFLRETVSRVRYGGASGQLTMRADSGFYTHAVVAVCRRINVRYSITIRQHKSLHNLIEAIPEDAWTPIPYWMDGAADVAETTYRACLTKPPAWFRATGVRPILASYAMTRLGMRQRISLCQRKPASRNRRP